MAWDFIKIIKLAKIWQKQCPKTWMKSPEEIELRKIVWRNHHIVDENHIRHPMWKNAVIQSTTMTFTVDTVALHKKEGNKSHVQEFRTAGNAGPVVAPHPRSPGRTSESWKANTIALDPRSPSHSATSLGCVNSRPDFSPLEPAVALDPHAPQVTSDI